MNLWVHGKQTFQYGENENICTIKKYGTKRVNGWWKGFRGVFYLKYCRVMWHDVP